MKIFIILYITLFSAIILYSAEQPFELAKINVDLSEISKNNKTKTVEFLSTTKKVTGSSIVLI